MEKKNKTYKDTVRGQVDNGVRIRFSPKAWQFPGSVPVYPRSDTSQCWIIDYLQSESKTYFPNKTYTLTIQIARNYSLGHGQFHGYKAKSKQ